MIRCVLLPRRARVPCAERAACRWASEFLHRSILHPFHSLLILHYRYYYPILHGFIYRVLMTLLHLATRQRAVLGATFINSDDSFGYMHPEIGLSGHVHAST